jgi:AraC-like DNA-binding protein
MATVLPPAEVLAPAAPVLRRRPGLPELDDVVATVWTTTVPERAEMLRVVPDAAVDLVFAGGRLVVAGPDTRPVRERMPHGAVMGFQLTPDRVPDVLGAPASACLNGRTDIVELWGEAGRILQEQLAESPDRVTAVALIERAIADRVHDSELDPLPGALRHALAQGRRIDMRRLGVGERQLRRRCVAAFGYPVSTLRRIVRFQRFMDAIATGVSTELASLAHQLGYSDQSDLTHQVREYSGLTPHTIRRLALYPLQGTTAS